MAHSDKSIGRTEVSFRRQSRLDLPAAGITDMVGQADFPSVRPRVEKRLPYFWAASWYHRRMIFERVG
jgi:hypothetical protein